MKNLGSAARYARTLRHLRPAQVVHRVRLRGQRALLARLGSRLEPLLQEVPADVPGWPRAFLPLDARLPGGHPSAEANATHTFSFLGEERHLGEPPDWRQRGSDQLWRYHLHYFEWVWSFAAHEDRAWARAAFAALWRSWRAGTRFGRWDEWSPYVASLRAWALCGVFDALVRGAEVESDVASQLAVHARFLRSHLELDVGGNHVVKNLKAMVGLGVLLGDERLVRVATARLRRQLRVQVLADGGHYERSPSYHCQVLADLIDVANLLEAVGRPAGPDVRAAIAAMRRWLGAMVLPDGDVPLFNDCVLVGAGRLALLEPAPPPDGHLIVLEASGYFVARPGPRLHLVGDIGPPCPPDLPAHAHADCLSFELAVDGRRLVVDTGTSTYTAGERRRYERSTRAHNTVEVNGLDQTEVWGAFRAGRRAQPTLEDAAADGGSIEVRASHDGYRHCPGSPVHRRVWKVCGERIEITDCVEATATVDAVVAIHVCGSNSEPRAPVSRLEIGPVAIEFSVPARAQKVSVATSFGALAPALRLVAPLRQAAPFVTSIELL